MNTHTTFPHDARHEITNPEYYRSARSMWQNQAQGSLVYELYNSPEAAEQWNKFNAKGRVVSPEVDLIKDLIRQHRSHLVAPAVIEGGPGGFDALLNKSKPLVLAAKGGKQAHEMTYVGLEASAPFRNTIVQFYSNVCQVTASEGDFFKPLSVHIPGALFMVLGVTMSNLISKPDNSLPFNELVNILNNFADAVDRNGQIIFSTDSADRLNHKDGLEITGTKFVESYNDPDFRKVYHLQIERQIQELGLVIHTAEGPALDGHGRPTAFKLDEKHNFIIGEDGHRKRLIEPNFKWTGQEVDKGDEGHKVAHNFRATEDLTLVFPTYQVMLAKDEERTALNAIKWKSSTIKHAVDALGDAQYIEQLQADNGRTTLHYIQVGDGGDKYRRHYVVKGASFAPNAGNGHGSSLNASRPVEPRVVASASHTSYAA